jgi:hypothetical protein
MAKRTRKPPIRPEVRREWLKRHEEEGESPPRIAAKDGFDVRTVRKQIELAKQEREAHEARSIVLRSALEKHYDDLRGYANKLNSEIFGQTDYESSPDDDFIEEALRQHLPRSPIWGYAAKWRNLQRKVEDERQALDQRIEELVSSEKRLAPLTNAGLKDVVPGIIAVLVTEAKQWSDGNTGHSLKDSLVIEPAGEGLVNPRFGFSHMGIMDKYQSERYVKIIHDVIKDLEIKVKESEEYSNLEKSVAETGRVTGKLREELAVIRLRRIVPGRCKYCPL